LTTSKSFRISSSALLPSRPNFAAEKNPEIDRRRFGATDEGLWPVGGANPEILKLFAEILICWPAPSGGEREQ
jgi:hypothetical protein